MWRFIFGKRTRKRVLDGAGTVVRFLTLKGLKAKEIEMELTTMYGNEALQISTRKKIANAFPIEQNRRRTRRTIGTVSQF
jgi:hypothetical protein